MNADDDTTSGGGFVGRWSARKRAAAIDLVPDPLSAATGIEHSMANSVSGPDAVEPLVPVEPLDPAVGGNEGEPAPTAAQETGEVVLYDADMPPIDSLDASSDLSGFFSSGVSAVLRRAALRHVFRSSRYNVRDGLNDYDGDYTVFEPLGDTVTADMKFHAARKERLAEEREREEAERLAQAELDGADELAGDGEREEDGNEADIGADASLGDADAGEDGPAERVDAGSTGPESDADAAPADTPAQTEGPLQLADSAIVIEQEEDTDRS